jgi:hypothetical protein
MPLNVKKELARLERMPIRELKDTYAEVFREQTRSGNRQWLIKRVIWRMQANEYGDLSERARQRAMELADDRDLRLKPPKATNGAVAAKPTTDDPRLPMPGTVLTRQYKGRTLQVTVLPEGFEYEGETYASLSAVAKAITGTHTSGFLFFRLNGKGGRQ